MLSGLTPNNTGMYYHTAFTPTQQLPSQLVDSPSNFYSPTGWWLQSPNTKFTMNPFTPSPDGAFKGNPQDVFKAYQSPMASNMETLSFAKCVDKCTCFLTVFSQALSLNSPAKSAEGSPHIEEFREPMSSSSPKKRKSSATMDSNAMYSHLGPENTRMLLIRNLQAAVRN